MADDGSSAHVLVIDDSEVARVDMRQRLSVAGFRVFSLDSPIGATRAIIDQAIDVVVIDVQMVSLRGDRLAALFRSNPRFASLGVILVTGGDDDEIAQLSAVAQADAVLSKGQLERLVPAVRSSLEKHRAAL